MKRSPYFGGGGTESGPADEDGDDFESTEGKRSSSDSGGGVQCPTHGSTCRAIKTKTGKWLCRCQTPGCQFTKWGIAPQAAYAMLKQQNQKQEKPEQQSPPSPPQAKRRSSPPSPAPSGQKRTRQRGTGRISPARPQLSLVSTEAPNGPESSTEQQQQQGETTKTATSEHPGGAVPDLPSFNLQMVGPETLYARFPGGEKGRACNEAMRGVRGAVWDAAEGAWTFPVRAQAEAVRRLQAAGAKVAPVPREVAAAFAQEPAHGEVADYTALSTDLVAAMFPFQLEGFAFGVQRGGRCLICDEMGLGKTLQAIAIAAHYRRDWPLLVVAPSSLRGNWAAEIRRWLPDVAPYDVQTVCSGREAPRALVTVVSYDLVARLALVPGQYPTIIADESHYLKNPASIRTRKVVPLLQAARHAILLTGTPALSRPIELYPQLVALNRPIFPNLVRFGRRYCAAHRGPHGWDYSGHSNLHELHALLAHTVMIRRLKAQVLRQLPAKRRQRVRIAPDPAFADALEEARAEMNRAGSSNPFAPGQNGGNGNNDSGSAGNDTRPAVTAFFNVSAQAKVRPVCEHLRRVLALRKKFLVFAHHQVMLDGIEALFRGAGIHHIRIDGSTPPLQRAEAVARFQSDSACHAALLSLTAAGTGLTLNAADIVVFAELYWTPGVLMQAEDRAHRIGQKNDVCVQYLVAAGTIDDLIWRLIERKMNVLGETMDGAASRLDHDTVEQASQALTPLMRGAPNVTAPAPQDKPSPQLLRAMAEARASGMSRSPASSASAVGSGGGACSTPLRHAGGGGQRVLTDFFAPAGAQSAQSAKPRVLALDSDDESEVEDVPDDDSSLGFSRLPKSLTGNSNGSSVVVAPATQQATTQDRDDLIEIDDDDSVARSAGTGTPSHNSSSNSSCAWVSGMRGVEDLPVLWGTGSSAADATATAAAHDDDADQDESLDDLAPGSQLWVPEPPQPDGTHGTGAGEEDDVEDEDDLLLSDNSMPSFAVTVVKG